LPEYRNDLAGDPLTTTVQGQGRNVPSFQRMTVSCMAMPYKSVTETPAAFAATPQKLFRSTGSPHETTG